MINAFSFARTPQLMFGNGKLSTLPSVVRIYGPKILLVTGARSFLSSSSAQSVLEQFKDNKIEWTHYTVKGEPSPSTVDDAVRKFFAFAPNCVVAIGGGSALDAGKAISAMLPLNQPVKEFLEGVGSGVSHPGKKIPFIAVPTTSGTGSEATKNAVICERGEDGYKRSLRHDNFVPNFAIVDPALTINCPKATTAASGMDAFTQLLESYVSTAANPVTDALALEGLSLVARSLLKSYTDGENLDARADMALAAYLSGITLANAGLGLVHGFASPIGGFFDVPHGVVCSALMGAANTVTIKILRSRRSNPGALRKYAMAGKLFASEKDKSDDFYIDNLLEVIDSLRIEMQIPRLSAYGIKREYYKKIADATDSKNNPARLDKHDMLEVLELSEAP